MPNWFHHNACPIGLDIGAHDVKVLQFKRHDSQLKLQAAARVQLPAEAHQNLESHRSHVADALLNILKNNPFVRRNCVSVLPAALVQTKSVRLPQMPEEEVAQAVKWEAKDRFGFELEEAGFAHFRAGEVRRGTELRDEYLLFAAPADALRSHVEMITALNVTLVGIDLQPSALVRAVERNLPSVPGAATCMIDLGAAGTQIAICQDGRLGFYKHIDIGAVAFDRSISEKLGVSISESAEIRARVFHQAAQHDESAAPAPLEQAVLDAVRPLIMELAKELDMCLRYYVVTFRAPRPDVVIAVGGLSYAQPVIRAIASALQLRVEQSHPLRGVGNLNDAIRPDRSSEWAVAAGLSLYDPAATSVEVTA